MALIPGLPQSPGSPPVSVLALLNAITGLVQELRLTGLALLDRVRTRPPQRSYETLWLELVLEISDVRGERAILTRRQGIRFHGVDGTIVRELVWGEGDQLVRYTAAGVRRLQVQREGSKRAVLLTPVRQPRAGDRLTIRSRRVIRGGFAAANEYCEALLERPTGRLDITVRFPSGRPPKTAQLVLGASEVVLRAMPVRFGPDGRAVLHCRLTQPVIGVLYSLRWSW